MGCTLIILDFYGLPGSGKSAISHEVAKILKKKNNIVCEPSYTIDHKNSKFVRIFRKLLNSLRWTLQHPYNFYRLLRIIKGHKLSFKNLLSEMINLLVKARFVEKYNGCDYLIFDEGFAQALISIDNMSSSFVNKELREIENIIGNKMEIFHVYIKEEINVALGRMEKRRTNDSRVEKEPSYTKKYEIMNRYNALCDTVAVNNPIIVEGDNRDVSTIAGVLVDNFTKYGV